MQGGHWIREREVGNGAFGIVTSWTNQFTHDKLVIKQVHSQNKLDPKSHSDWLKEIDLMNTMKHKNIVSGRQVPEEIKKVMNSPTALLGLELCDYDLRKVLTQPMNCCGLKEKNVLNILRDVSCGMKFLHENMKITHRDLKPENILLKHRDNETVYKITDLGVAKRIDANSICMSFVGTLQYLAPELYDHASGYTYTADYWSFGTVLFECITGERPFLLTDKPFDWFQFITNKKDEQIWGYFDENVGTKLCTELPSPTHLSTPLLSAFKEWLQLVLRQDRQKRGKNIITGERECFTSAYNILQLKVIHVFDMVTCKEVAYDSQYGRLGSDLKIFLERELNFPKDDQLLLFAATGGILNDDDPLDNEDLFKGTIFLFCKNKSGMHPIVMDIPEKVIEIMRSPDELHSYVWLKKAYAHSVFYCRNSGYKYKCLLRGVRALLINMKTRKKLMLDLKEQLDRETVKLETMIDLFVTITNSDVNYMMESGNSNCEAYKKEWDPMLTEVQSFLKRDLNMKEIQSIQKLQENAAGIQVMSDTELDRLADEAEKLFATFRASESHKKSNAKSMSVIVGDCKSRSESLFKLSIEHLTCVMKSYDEIGSLNASMVKKIANLKSKYKLVMEYQLCRQRSLLRKLCLNDSSMSLIQCDLLVGLECAFEKADNGGAPHVEFSAHVITDMCGNFEKLKKLTCDEKSGTEAGIQTILEPVTTTATSSDNVQACQSLNLSSTNISQQGSTMIRSSSAPSHLHNVTQISSEKGLPSHSNSSSSMKFNEIRGKCNTLNGSQYVNISPAPYQNPNPNQLSEYHMPTVGMTPRPVGGIYDNSLPPMMMMMHPCNNEVSSLTSYDSWSAHPPHQFDTSNYRQPASLVSNASQSSSTRHGRCIPYGPRASEFVCGGRPPFVGSPYGSAHGITSYNLRMQHFSNAQYPSTNYKDDTCQYDQLHPMNSRPQVYHRGYFVPIIENVDLMSL